MGIPHLIVPGCVDMANFGGMDTVPDRFKKPRRNFYEWNPSVTLMRTNKEENEKMGKKYLQKKPMLLKVPLLFYFHLKEFLFLMVMVNFFAIVK